MNNDIINYEKNLNSRCICKSSLPFVKDEVIMLYPCEHLIHMNCFKKIGKRECPYCNNYISKIIRYSDKDIHYQRYADILSMSYYHNLTFNSFENFFDSIFDLASIIIRMPFLDNPKNGKELCKNVFALNNLTLKVSGMEKLKLVNTNKVFICNHVSYLEFIIIYYLFDCGFLASSIVDSSKLMSQIKKVAHLLTFKRGEKKKKGFNIIDEMRKFVDTQNNICLFPEGLMHHPDTLTKFRTGCFHINRPIYSIVIKHNDVIMDETVNGFLIRLGSKKNINIEVIVQGPYLPPFSKTDMDNVRIDMAKKGEMMLSRVSNRDINDVNTKDVKL